MTEILSYKRDYKYKILDKRAMGLSTRLSRVLVEIENPLGEISRSRMISKFPNCKNPEPEWGKSSQSSLYAEKIMGLAAAKIPVVPYVHLVSDKQVLIPDLIVNGGIILDKHSSFLSPKRVTRADLKLIRGFDISEAIYKLTQIVTLADMNNIGLPFDDPLAIYIDPNLIIHPLVLDLDWTNLKGDFSDVQGNRIAFQIISQHLQGIKKDFT